MASGSGWSGRHIFRCVKGNRDGDGVRSVRRIEFKRTFEHMMQSELGRQFSQRAYLQQIKTTTVMQYNPRVSATQARVGNLEFARENGQWLLSGGFVDDD